MYPHVGMSSAMYSQAANPAGYYASAFTPMQAYYHPLAYSYPQPQLRPAIMIPVSWFFFVMLYFRDILIFIVDFDGTDHESWF
ncbi:unnamed protein product, partial [Nesidiocoris tenuis]